MNNQNICKFIPTPIAMRDVIFLNFVCERDQRETESLISSVYKIALIISGEGVLTTAKGEFPIRDGELFFLFQAQHYTLQHLKDLQFIYISFVGTRFSPLFERLRLSSDRPLRHGFGFLVPRWMEALNRMELVNSDLVAGAVPYETLSYLADGTDPEGESETEENNLIAVKVFVDDHSIRPELPLNWLLPAVIRIRSIIPRCSSVSFKNPRKRLLRFPKSSGGFSMNTGNNSIAYACTAQYNVLRIHC